MRKMMTLCVGLFALSSFFSPDSEAFRIWKAVGGGLCTGGCPCSSQGGPGGSCWFCGSDDGCAACCPALAITRLGGGVTSSATAVSSGTAVQKQSGGFKVIKNPTQAEVEALLKSAGVSIEAEKK